MFTTNTLLSISLALFSATSSALASPSPSPTQAPDLAKRAGSTPLPLTAYSYAYDQIPYQVNPYQYLRGPQTGYNVCNSTTEGAGSMCQTAILNSISDFCLWGAPGLSANETIGDVEAAVVAYCSKSGHGARIFPAGSITGLQVLKTSAYTQWTGFINQNALGLTTDDSGGELDPHGADELGNPLGGLVYSSGLPSGNNSTLKQVVSWNNFIGSGVFCFKICDPSVTDKNYCQNIYDLIGCSYNMPAAYVDKTFLECDSDLQDEVGTYTSNGQTYTWSQPSSLPATSTLPWTPRVPSSSNCKTYQSSDLFPLASLGYQASGARTSSASSARTTSGASASASGSASRSASSGSMAASRTTSSGTARSTGGTASAAAASSTTKTAFAVAENAVNGGGVIALVMGALGAFLL